MSGLLLITLLLGVITSPAYAAPLSLEDDSTLANHIYLPLVVQQSSTSNDTEFARSATQKLESMQAESPAQPDASPSPRSVMGMTLMTYNLGTGTGDGVLVRGRYSEAFYQDVVNYIVTVNPDVITFQEIEKKSGTNSRNEPQKLYDMLKLRGMNYNVKSSWHWKYDGLEAGVSTFSKYAIISSQEKSWTLDNEKRRMHTLLLQMPAPFPNIRVFNYHPHGKHNAGCRAPIILRQFRQQFSEFSLLLGDYNLQPEEACFQQELSPYFVSLCNTKGTSDQSCVNSVNYYDYPHSPGLIDQVLTDRNYQGVCCFGIMRSVYERYADQNFRRSDHLPVVVRMSFVIF